eukprot:1635346-Prymnesium_polylepis.1
MRRRAASTGCSSSHWAIPTPRWAARRLATPRLTRARTSTREGCPAPNPNRASPPNRGRPASVALSGGRAWAPAPP